MITVAVSAAVSLLVRLVALALLVGAAVIPVGAFLWADSNATSAVTPRRHTAAAPVRSRWLGSVPQYRGIVVLTFHDVLPQPHGRYTIDPRQFERDLAALHAAGVHTVSTGDFLRYLRGERIWLPPRSVLLTFDDGTKGNWVYADPILQRYGYHAVEFVITSAVGTHQPYYLTWDELRRMRSSGRWDIESHTRAGHGTVPVGPSGLGGAFVTNRAWDDKRQTLETEGAWRTRVVADLAASIDDIVRERLPKPRLFAFPFSATETPNNDPAIPVILKTVTGQLFAARFQDDRHARPVLPHQQGYIDRLEVFRDTSAFQLLSELRSASSSPANRNDPMVDNR